MSFTHVARPPNVPRIYEDDEPLSSSNDGPVPVTEDRQPKPRKSTTKPRLSTSRLLFPSRSMPSPPPPPHSVQPKTPHVDFTVAAAILSELGHGDVVRKQRPRRESGFVITTTTATITDSDTTSQAHVGDMLKKDSLSVASPTRPRSALRSRSRLVWLLDEFAGVAAARRKEKKWSPLSSSSVGIGNRYKEVDSNPNVTTIQDEYERRFFSRGKRGRRRRKEWV
jgi:hypothetical protein